MALEDLTATAQHFRNAGFTNLDIGALFIAQALDRIADALEAGGGMQGPPQPSATPAAPKVAPGPDWITHRVPTYEDADEDGEVQILTPPVPGERRQPIHVQWASVYPGTPWHPG
jgi:hypothetical protein